MQSPKNRFWRCIKVGVAAFLFPAGTLLYADESSAGETAALPAEEVEFFEKKIRPLLAEHCFSCHSSQARSVHGGLKLDSAGAIAKGGDSGPVVVSGGADKSLLIEVVRYDGEMQMPPKGRLSEHEIALLERWVNAGAVFPGTVATVAEGGVDFEKGKSFWSFQPVKTQPQPYVKHMEWPRQPLDYFVLARMEQAGLAPSPEAGREELLRRLTFDLTGLPPTLPELDQFVNDASADALEHQVDRLLQSPAFGERWARVWLDLARYTDKTASWLDSTGEAHLYRDWVVEAFNTDMPYDDFVRRQLATDMMDETGAKDVAALGFIGLSPNYWKELKLPAEIIKVIVADEWEERVDAVSRTFLGLTVACARCHDHKFDPISTEDYYALAGVFASCRIGERPTISADLYQPVKAAKDQITGLEKQRAELKKKKPIPEDELKAVEAKISAIKSSTPHIDAPIATGLIEESLFVIRAGERADQGTKLDYRKSPRDLNLFIRGNPNRPGPVIPRRFLTVLSASDPTPFSNGSGRLELANAITTDAAALTARVIVNRIWAVYFGRGIVDTPSNFGALGGRPSHPALLDDLAARLIRANWSLKQLHREIVLSATYRQSSRGAEETTDTDPDNRLLSRMNRRRLDFEQWRDAMLSACGELDLQQGGPSQDLLSADNKRRTLYATVHRREMSDVMLNHDFPAPTSHSPGRARTTTALQGLFTLNGPLLESQAAAFMKRLHSEAEDDRARIELAYRLLFARKPTTAETTLGLEFLEHATQGGTDETWQQYTHVLLAGNEFLYLR